MIERRRFVLGLYALAAGGAATQSQGRTLGSGDESSPPVGNSRFELTYGDFLRRFVRTSGRVVDDHNGEVSHSESQGYGLLVAAFANDRPTFDRIYAWTRAALMIRGDGLAAWRWDPRATPHVADMNNATDGDLLIAYALLEAYDRWGGPYQDDARAIAGAIAGQLTYEHALGLMLKPGVTAFEATDWGGAPVVNLSYWIFPALERLARDNPNGPWNALNRSGLALVDACRFGPAELPSDWISLGNPVAPAPGKAAVFGYDAIRVPLYLAWACPEKRSRLAPFVRSFVNGQPQIVDLSTGKPIGTFGGNGFGRLANAVGCEAPSARNFLRSDETYYPTILGLLADHVDCNNCAK